MSKPVATSNRGDGRLLLVTSSYLPNLGGLERITSLLAGELWRGGYAVSVLAQRYPRRLSASEEIDGVQVDRVLFLFPRLSHLRAGRFDLFLAGLFYFPTTLARLIWRLARQQPEVVNLHFLGSPALFVLLARTLMRFRLVVSLHGDDVEGLPRGTHLDRWIFCAILRRADAVTANSRHLLDQALKIEPAIAGKAQVIYNGYNSADLSVSIPDRRHGDFILAVGRMVPKKGFDVLIRALTSSALQDVSVVLIGDGPERDRLESLARDLRLDGRIEFRGKQDHHAVLRAMACSRLLVIPSRQEPFGLVALEAMTAGKPVVATRTGGLPEVLQNADAVLVEPDHVAALADGLTSALTRLAGQPTFGVRNRALAARFASSQMVEAYLQVYYGHSMNPMALGQKP